MRKTRPRRGGIIRQAAVLVFAGILVTGAITYLSFSFASGRAVRVQNEQMAARIAAAVERNSSRYPAWDWLLEYWTDHAGELDVEYEADFSPDSANAEKIRRLSELCPGIEVNYVTEEDLGQMPDEAKKLYAEAAYSRLASRFNEMKQAAGVESLFMIAADEECGEQVCLVSGAVSGETRGTGDQQVMPFGWKSAVSGRRQGAMKDAMAGVMSVAEDGDLAYSYAYMTDAGGRHLFLGVSCRISSIRARIRGQAIGSTAFGMIFQVILAALCLGLIFFFVIRPFRKVQQSIRYYKDSKDGERVRKDLSRVRPDNEIGQLSEDVSSMTEEIDSYMVRVQEAAAERERVASELDLAAKIQKDMLPDRFPAFPDRKEFDIFADMDPARLVGGDFYDFFLIDEDHLGIVMADVSGKGIPASLFMMSAKTRLHSEAQTGKSPAKVLETVNSEICADNSEEMFVTVWFGILTVSTGRVIAANAGHEYPIIKSGDGPFRLMKDRHGFVVGAMEGQKYPEYEFFLNPGDTLFLYTDGLPEANNGKDELFGTDRVLAVLNRETDAAPGKILKNMQAAVGQYVGEAPQFDDLTMLALKMGKMNPAEGEADEQGD